ncbi:MAG: tRNA (pseudouridine(54)-N(1))-methyltransferase TrmY [Candidatus Acetothermia bacterium]|nr:tRNA (pseudouridine(54)-N(1))-methyltransferase TrmY [Candidatus Acetothermia bacterium]MDH7505170.1 tRNA (pseudouridine(54)-N(1))-methyltransferase TrmY [Candidatus Acetothermia bacterium]
MRVFIVLGHRARLDPGFSLNDLPGSAGRIDVLCRCVNSAFCLSHDLRRDTELYLVLQDQVTLRFVGSRLRHLNPDERSTAALIQRALAAREQLAAEPALAAAGQGEVESTPGIYISHRGLREVLSEAQSRVEELILLHEAGLPLRQAELAADSGFVLSDHLEFLPGELELMVALPKLSLGPLSLHADHCIVIVHNELDLRFGSGACYNGRRWDM